MTEEENEINNYINQPPTGNYNQTKKELAEQEAYTILYYGSLRKYAEDKEKEQGWLSRWQEHKDDEDEYTYYSVDLNNDSIVEEIISKIQSDLDLIIEQVKKNSSKDLIKRKIPEIKGNFCKHPNSFTDCVQYLFYCIGDKYIANLGHTEAWIWLYDYLEDHTSIKTRDTKKKKEINTPKLVKGKIDVLYDSMLHWGFINKDYKVYEFAECFKGKPIGETNPIKFNKDIKGTTKVYLFVRLLNEGFIEIDTEQTLDTFLNLPTAGYFKSQKSRFTSIDRVTNLMEIKQIMSSLNTSI